VTRKKLRIFPLKGGAHYKEDQGKLEDVSRGKNLRRENLGSKGLGTLFRGWFHTVGGGVA